MTLTQDDYTVDPEWTTEQHQIQLAENSMSVHCDTMDPRESPNHLINCLHSTALYSSL
jgi:hypothetical protein